MLRLIISSSWMNQNIGTIFFQSVTLSLVVPAVLTLYNGVLEQLGDVKFLRKLLLTLRDRLKNRFAGIFVNVKMAFSVDISKEAFSSKVYLAAAVLDPNLKLQWLDDVHIPSDDLDDDDEDLPAKEDLRQELTGMFFLGLCTLHAESIQEQKNSLYLLPVKSANIFVAKLLYTAGLKRANFLRQLFLL